MELEMQAKTFVVVVATGILLGVLFEVYRILRWRFRPHWLITTVADLIYCLLATAITFAALLLSNWGEFRFYVVIALLSGVFAYYRLASRYVSKLIITLFTFLVRIWQTVARIVGWAIIRPLSIIARTIFWPAVFVGKRCKNWYKKWRLPPPPPDQIPPV